MVVNCVTVQSVNSVLWRKCVYEYCDVSEIWFFDILWKSEKSEIGIQDEWENIMGFIGNLN